MEARFDWGRYDFGTFRRRDVLTMGRFDCKAVGHFKPKFQGEGVVPGEYFLVSTKLDTFCYPTIQTAPCYVPSF